MPVSRLYLIDAHALCYRAFYAIKGLTTNTGQATNAVYGFTNTLRKILREHKPEYLAVCFDSPTKTRRQEKFAEYKIHRPKMPDEMISQMVLIKDVVRAYRLPLYEIPGFEADDIIATLTRKFGTSEVNVVIVSDDKDMFQLVTDEVKVLSSRKEKILGPAEVEETIGVKPEQVTDFIGLAGDSSDNIPGVKGIGEVTAKKLIQEYGGLENILKHLDEIKPKRAAEVLAEQKEMAVLSRDLGVLDKNAPVDIKLPDLRVGPPDNKRLFELFKDFEFNRFAEEISQDIPAAKGIAVSEVRSERDLAALRAAIEERGEVAFQQDAGEAAEGTLWAAEMFVGVGPENIYRLSTDQVKALREVWENPAIVKITHDVKEKIKILADLGIDLKGKVFDIKLAAYLLSPARADYTVKDLAWQYLKTAIPDENKTARETAAIAQMHEPLSAELKEKNLLSLFDEIEIPLAFVLAAMEQEGVTINQEHLSALAHKCGEKINGLVKELYRLAEGEFNLNSPKQLSEVLFQKLKLPVIKRTKTGFSTDEEVLTKLAGQHPLPAMLLEYRQLAKLKSTYIDALPKMVDPATQKIHASFNQTGTETGRLSSNNPNLQNIPIRTELGREIRRAFVPTGRDHVIVSADYSQIELRVLAHLSGDENLQKAFRDGEDIHTSTAAQIFEVEEKDVTGEMRYSAKRVNFGIIYGMSAFGLAKDLGITQEQAGEFIDRYFLRYPKVKEFMDDQIAQCAEKGFVTTILNRRRYIPDIMNTNNAVRQFAERQAINTPVQGSAADLIKLAMVRVQAELDRGDWTAKMIITVHDELVFEVKKSEQARLVNLIRDRMENVMALQVPIKVKVEVGPNWLDMKEV